MEEQNGKSENKNNYSVLGLPDNAEKDVVKRKYGALLRQYKQKTDEYGVTDEDARYYQEITDAYDSIMGITHDFSDDDPTSPIPYPIRHFWAKLCAYFEQYNILIICIALVIVGGIIFIVQYKSNGKEDLIIKFVGAFDSFSDSELKKQIDEKSKSVDNVQLGFYTVTTETDYDNYSTTQATVFLSQLLSGNLDVVLIDKESFDVYVAQKAFLDLNEFIDSYEKNGGNASKLYLYDYESGQDDKIEVKQGIYGIEVKDAAFFEGFNFDWLYDTEKGQEKTMIFAICRTAERMEKAYEFGAEILDSIP